MHNQLLNETLTNLKQHSSRSGEQTLSDISDNALSYMIQRSIANTSRSEILLEEKQQIIRDLTNKEVPAIRQEMSEREIEFIDRAIYSVEQHQQAIDALLIEAAESDLPELHKEAVMNFLATLQSSEIYWEENDENWTEYLRTHLSQDDFEAFKLDDPNVPLMQVAFADAYYIWWGTLNSGCNMGIGLCCGAVGSLFTYLNIYYK